jgi:hypothetical protein
MLLRSVRPRFSAKCIILAPSTISAINGVISAHLLSLSRNFSSESKGGKVPLSTKIKEGLLHYWQGSKLLAYETKISSRLLLKLLKGDNLIRREQIQLRRTTSDLLRLVPFAVILIVPFLEFALPILLKFFPNMLPSTFEDSGTQVCTSLLHFY